MITVIVGLLSAFLIYMSIAEKQWGVLALVGVFLFFYVIGLIDHILSSRAYIHRRNYWAMSGKDRAKARNQWAREAREEEEREREKAHERYLRKQERRASGSGGDAVAEHASNANNVRNPFVCCQCGGWYQEESRKRYSDGTAMINCICHGCGNRKLLKLEDWMGEYPLKMAEKKAPEGRPAGNATRVLSAEEFEKERPDLRGRSPMSDMFGTNNDMRPLK